jgi:hypothetical protein
MADGSGSKGIIQAENLRGGFGSSGGVVNGEVSLFLDGYFWIALAGWTPPMCSRSHLICRFRRNTIPKYT